MTPTTIEAPTATPSISVNRYGGMQLSNCRNTSEALAAAGMDWGVIESPLSDSTGPISGWKSLRRADTDAQLAIVTSSYQTVQNWEAFAPLDAFLGDIELDHALCLRGGRRVALTARIGLEADVVPGDPVEGFLVIHTSHDGSLSYGVTFTSVRVICENTLGMAMDIQRARREREGTVEVDNASIHRKGIAFKHTAGITRQINRIPEVLDLKRRQFSTAVEHYRLMQSTPCDDAAFRQYLEAAFRSQLWDAEKKQHRPLDSLRSLDYLTEAFEAGIGADTMRGTVWGAYNAITQFATHRRGKEEDCVESNLFGSGAQLLASAHRAALAMV